MIENTFPRMLDWNSCAALIPEAVEIKIIMALCLTQVLGIKLLKLFHTPSGTQFFRGMSNPNPDPPDMCTSVHPNALTLAANECLPV